MKDEIIIVAGGTGGHVFPAVSVADELSSKFKILFVTDERGKKYAGKYKDSAIIQSINNKSRIGLYISVGINTLKSLYFLSRNKPSCVVGFGGYPSIPFVLAAQLLRIKTVVHEQNAVIGLANKLLSKMATKTMFSFNGYGTPTRFENVYDGFIYTHSQKPHFRLFIIGGSQGSQIVTKNVVQCLCSLPQQIRLNLFVYHQTRPEDIDYVREMYQNHSISCQVQSFFHNMGEIYRDVDLIVSRSGASTVFEIIGFKIPVLLIPFSGSINGDQKANAKVLEDAGMARVFDENDLEKLTETIQELYDDRGLLVKMSESAQKLYVRDITKLIAETICLHL